MSKPIHYRPNGQKLFCYVEGANTDRDTAFADSIAGRTSTDIRRVTCPLCLHAVAGSMIRKGVPIKLTTAGKTFYETFIKTPAPRAGERSVIK